MSRHGGSASVASKTGYLTRPVSTLWRLRNVNQPVYPFGPGCLLLVLSFAEMLPLQVRSALSARADLSSSRSPQKGGMRAMHFSEGN